MLDASQRVRFARQLLLDEIGEAGQTRLCAARPQLAESADPRASATALDYLERAGMSVASQAAGPARSVQIAAPERVRVLAGRPELEEAAAALAGAFAAVEAIKAELAIGRSADLPDVSLARGVAR